jgi:hypothetical protein
MKKYIGTKKLEATPMTLGDYQKTKGFNVGFNEDPNKEGYFVQYSDDYVSWSPKEVFEESYVLEKGHLFNYEFEMPHQQRVAEEAKELAEKSIKLNEFIDSNPLFDRLSVDEQKRMKLQLTTMQCYYSILVERIENF